MIRLSPSQTVVKVPHIAYLRPSRGNSVQGTGYFGSLTSQSVQGTGYFGSLTSQSVQGTGYFGSLTSQSVQGGGSFGSNVGGIIVSGIPIDTGAGKAVIDTYFKFGSNPVSATTLLDLDFGALGFARLYITSDGKLHFDSSFNASSEQRVSTSTLDTGEWYWFATRLGSPSGWVCNLTAPGGIAIGMATAGAQAIGGVLTCRFGMGMALSNNYLNVPNNDSWLFKDIILSNDSGDADLPPPSTDPVAGTKQALYIMRQTVGIVTTLTDSTANAQDLVAGPNGMTINVNGPYA